MNILIGLIVLMMGGTCMAEEYIGEYYEPHKNIGIGADFTPPTNISWTKFTRKDIKDNHKAELSIHGKWIKEENILWYEIHDQYHWKREEIQELFRRKEELPKAGTLPLGNSSYGVSR